MPLPTSDAAFLQTALTLAEHAVGLSEPTPRVGCVITSADGQQVLGQGHTQAAGSAHAEVMALRDAQARGADVRGACVYVTLEPCAHHGRTPPCCDALVAAGVGRVVVAVGDPNPAVNGQGLARLRAAGIDTAWGPPELAEAARALNIGFFSRMERGRPWVRMKMAASLDGRTALSDGRSQWITEAAARVDGHAFRRRAGALLTGSGTVRLDDPRLDVRLVPTARQPLRAVVDSQLVTPPGARLFQVANAPLLMFTAHPPADRVAALRAQGAEVVPLPAPDGRVDLDAALAELARRGVNELHVEAGQGLNGALLSAGLVDELLLYLAPMLIGPGLGLADLPALAHLPDAPRWQFMDAQAVGNDLRLRLRRPRSA